MAEAHDVRRDSALRRAGLVGAAVRLGTLVIALVTVSVSVHALGNVLYGVAATLATITALLGFADLGIGQGLLTKLANAHGREDVAEMRALVSSAWTTLMILGAGVAVIGVVLTYVLPWTSLLGAPESEADAVQTSVLIFFLATAIAVPASIGQRVQIALQHGARVSGWLLGTSVATLIAVVLAALLDATLPVFVFAIVAVPVFSALAQTVVVLGRTHIHLRPARASVSREKIRELMSVGGLFLALGIAVAIAYQTDTLVVSSILGAASAATFAIAFRMFTAVSGLFSGLTQQLWPAIAEALSRGDVEWVRSRFLRVLGITVGGSAVLCLGLVLFGQTFARIAFGEDVVPPVSLLVAFALWTVYSLGMVQCSYLLNASSVVAPQVVMAAGVAIVNIPVSISLTHKYGLPGPLYGSLIAHLLCAGAPTIWLVRRRLRDRGPDTVNP